MTKTIKQHIFLVWIAINVINRYGLSQYCLSVLLIERLSVYVLLYICFFCVYFNYFGLLWAWLSVCDQTFHFTPLRNVLFIHLLVDCRVVHQTLSSQSQPHSNWCLFTRRQHGHAVCWLSQQRLKTFTSNICVEFIQSNTVYKIIRIPLKKDVMLYLMLRIYNI